MSVSSVSSGKVKGLTLLLRILEVQGSNLGPEIAILTEVLVVFSVSPGE
jgi:hypothetical protein